jgi:4-alpha-glucanotransferase
MRFSRSSGILLHPTSLPGPHGSGDLGAAAYHFIDWLVLAGQHLWQMLPLGPCGIGNSPYMCLSAFAGNPLLIDLQELVNRGWLDQARLGEANGFSPHRVDSSGVNPYRMTLLRFASDSFLSRQTPSEKLDFELFCDSHKNWLDDYSLFCSLNDKFDGQLWTRWDADVANRKPSSLEIAKVELQDGIQFHKFTQWCFFRQWSSLKKYANEHGVKIIGDLPMFVAHHSSDVWGNPGEFYLDSNGNPTAVAGVPPDYFSKTGQRWGNPLYRWDVIRSRKFKWWIDRFKSIFEMCDIVRIDHFRGFVACWEIPAKEETAVKGRWVEGPGEELFSALVKKLVRLPIIAEDLGYITADVAKLREDLGFPGMKVLQFAFGGGVENPFLPHNYSSNSVVYTGTHDNDTTIGWYRSSTERERDFVRRYMNVNGEEIHRDFVKLALRSVADLAILPFQDVLGLGSEHRMNLPGTTQGNWEWRFTWDMVQPHLAIDLFETTALSARCNPEKLGLPSSSTDLSNT